MSNISAVIENQISSPFLNVREAAKYLRISDSALYKLVQKRLIKHRTHGSHLFFVIKELNEWSETKMRDKNTSRKVEYLHTNDKLKMLLESRKSSFKTKDQKREKS